MPVPETRMSDDYVTHLSLDPTNRTLATLQREIENVSERLESRIRSEARLGNEKFDSVSREFELIERMRVEQKLDTKQAVDAALIAQKEAVKEQTLASEKSIAKSEAATAKQIDALSVSFNQAMDSLLKSQNDLKDRVVSMESGIAGRVSENRDHRASLNTVIAGATGTVSAAGVIIALIIKFH